MADQGATKSMDFGKKPPRSLESFGVSGMLGPECKVYYDTLFTSRGLGRVSDLLSAKLKDASPDELKLRALILYTLFEAYQSISKQGEALQEPVTLECGIDDEKVAVGVSFVLPAETSIDVAGAQSRVQAGAPQGSFEELLKYLLNHAHRLVVRYQPDIRRVELVSIMGLAGRMDDRSLSSPHVMEVITLGNAPGKAPKAGAYIELGDLNYTELLKKDGPGSAAEEIPASGEFLAQVFEPKSSLGKTEALVESTLLADALKARGKPSESDSTETVVAGTIDEIQDESIHVKGSTEQADTHVAHVEGGAENPDQSVTKIQGTTEQLQDDFLTVKSGDDGESPQTQAANSMYLAKIEELQKKVAELEEEKKSLIATHASEEPKSKPSVNTFLKSMWPFKKKDEDEDPEEDSESDVQAEQIEPEASEESDGAPEELEAESGEDEEEVEEEGAKASDASSSQESHASAEVVAKTLANEIQVGNLDRTISKAQKEASELKKEIGNGRAKRWVDGLMGELVSEKSRLQELAKKVTVAVRQKELEFRGKEQALQEELRRRDEVIRQKANALLRTKDQLAQSAMMMERLKSASQNNPEENQFKHKFNQAQKMLQASKAENKSLQEKVAELRDSLASAQLASKTKGPSAADHSALQAKFDRVNRMVEDLKRTNTQLMEKIADQQSKKEKPTAANMVAEENKKRLDTAMKSLAASKRKEEALNLKVEELQREETRLRKELERALSDLKKTRDSSNKPPAAA